MLVCCFFFFFFLSTRTTDDIISDLICIIQNLNISGTKEGITKKKKKKHYSSLLKAFQMRRSYFLLNPKPYPVLDICQEKIPCLRQKSQKTYPDWPHVPLSLIREYSPPRHQNKVFMRNHSYQNVFSLHIHFHAIQTHFHKVFCPAIIGCRHMTGSCLGEHKS